MNKDDLDFDNAESTVPTQEWDLVEDTFGQVAEYSTRYSSPFLTWSDITQLAAFVDGMYSYSYP